MPPFYKTIEFWTAVLTPILVVLWPLAIAKLSWLSVLTAEQLTLVIAGGIVAIIVSLTGFAVMRHLRAARLGLR
jgi:hypothetical protein